MPRSLTTPHDVMRLAQNIVLQCEADSESLDGLPVNGVVIAAKFGEVLANTLACAKAIEALAQIQIREQ